MRWKSVALAGVIGPAAAGCNIAHYAAVNIVNEPHVVLTQHAIEHDLRKSARAAWEEARLQCGEYADSAPYRDGFIDGFVDYLDRGGNGSLPAVPPAKYTRHKKYFTETGQCLVKVYFLGFKHGQEVAIASGRRQLLTLPVLLPQEPTGPVAFNVQPAPAKVPPPQMPIPTPPPDSDPMVAVAETVPIAISPAPEPPALPFEPVLEMPLKGPPPGEFEPRAKPMPVSAPVRLEPVRLPADPRPIPALPDPVGPPRWGTLPPIPELPADAASKPSEGSTPRRVLPPNHTVRPPLPPNHPKPRN